MLTGRAVLLNPSNSVCSPKLLRGRQETPISPLLAILAKSVHLPYSTGFSLPLFSYTCALFCTERRRNPFLFKRFRTLCTKTPGGGVCLPLSFLSLAKASGLPTSSAPSSTGHGARITVFHTSLRPYFHASETATPFPQRWGLLRKGRTVFRREDRYTSKTQFSGGGGGGGKVVRNFPRWPCSMV